MSEVGGEFGPLFWGNRGLSVTPIKVSCVRLQCRRGGPENWSSCLLTRCFEQRFETRPRVVESHQTKDSCRW
jgi:hypothetical protein